MVFFDVEEKDIDNWSKRLEIIKRLRRLRKKPQIRVRLLMTTGCIEYWLMLHYRLFAPPVLTVPEKEQMLRQVIKEEPTYKKGNYIATARIAQHYPTAVKNAGIVLQNLLKKECPVWRIQTSAISGCVRIAERFLLYKKQFLSLKVWNASDAPCS